MNRLIILGNGFDLAHGLKTSYSDFIIDLVKTELDASFRLCEWDNYTDKGTYKNGPIRITIEGGRRFDHSAKKRLDGVETFEDLKIFLKTYNVNVLGSMGKSIFSNTFAQLTSYSWADIEAIYYEILLSIVDKNTSRKLHENKKGEVIRLNQELDFFRDRLIEYLEKVETASNPLTEPFIKTFGERVCGRSNGLIPTNIHLLNFNYTNTLGNYGGLNRFSKPGGMELEINHIHGNLTNPESIIFGYGDEVDSFYKRMEDLNENELLRHAKSFGYFKNDSYQRLLRFLDSGDFEVWVVGHSCGLSDRVMLKKIFEHPRCRVITIHHYWNGELNDHTEKTFQISRHFDNKELMREKIKPFDPQDCISEWIYQGKS